MSPKTGERKFEKTYAATLIGIAKDDCLAAAALAKNSRTRKETALFLVQQCIEKSLKAVLCHLEVPVPLVHDLGALVGKLPEKFHPPYGYELTRFNDYAGILRYERGSEKISASDVLSAIKIAKQVHNWALAIIKKSR
jgi:HEPN domain-containing protein